MTETVKPSGRIFESDNRSLYEKIQAESNPESPLTTDNLIKVVEIANRQSSEATRQLDEVREDLRVTHAEHDSDIAADAAISRMEEGDFDEDPSEILADYIDVISNGDPALAFSDPNFRDVLDAYAEYAGDDEAQEYVESLVSRIAAREQVRGVAKREEVTEVFRQRGEQGLEEFRSAMARLPGFAKLEAEIDEVASQIQGFDQRIATNLMSGNTEAAIAEATEVWRAARELAAAKAETQFHSDMQHDPSNVSNNITHGPSYATPPERPLPDPRRYVQPDRLAPREDLARLIREQLAETHARNRDFERQVQAGFKRSGAAASKQR